MTSWTLEANKHRGFWRKGQRFNNVGGQWWLSVGTLYKSILLFALNSLDAQLTLIWVRLNVATEGNVLMARVLDYGVVPFLGAKLGIGAFAAYILYRFAYLPIARRGLTAVIVIYLALMVLHAATGFLALGWHLPVLVLGYCGGLPNTFISLFI